MDETVKDLVDIQCIKCNKVTKTRRAKVDGSKLPMGWKRPNGQPVRPGEVEPDREREFNHLQSRL